MRLSAVCAVCWLGAAGCGGGEGQGDPSSDGGTDAGDDAAVDAAAALEPCVHDADCPDLACLVLGDGAELTLGCGPAGPGAAAGGACEGDEECRSLRCERRVCGAPCSGNGDCPAGMLCTDVATELAGEYRGCGFRSLEQEGQIDEVDLGPVDIAGLASDIVSVVVPDDAISVTVDIVQVEGEEPLVLGFDDVTQPDGEVILDADLLLSSIDQPLRNFAYPGVGVQTMLIPNSTEERLRIQPGSYSWRSTSEPAIAGGPWPDTRVHATAWIKRASEPPTSGTVDLDVYLLDERLTAETAPGDARLAEVFATVDGIWAQVGLALGDVAFHDPPADEVARLSRIDSLVGADSELADLFRLSGGSRGRRIDLFLVRRLSGVLGIAGGVPGPALLHGTGRSGVAVVDEEKFATAEQTGGIMAHELGHYLGLYHSTEDPAALTLFEDDPLADTTTGDQTNLMYFQSLNSARGISEGQGFVLLRNPLVH